MATASPYTMKFAGYSDRRRQDVAGPAYKVRNSQLEGANQIVIDKLTLGERVDSPDALKLPLELAIAILKDSNGRIDLGLPVSGNLDDPQFSYGALIWKAFGSLLTKIVTAPFRALDGGGGGEKLEAIDFDPGSDKLLPPEREKLKQVAQLLAKRRKAETLRAGAVQRSGRWGRAAGARGTCRGLAARRHQARGRRRTRARGPGQSRRAQCRAGALCRPLWRRRTREAKKGGRGRPPDAKTEAAQAQQKLSAWQRFGKTIQGEPPVADASSFYGKLLERLNQSEPLAPDALTKLGAQRGGRHPRRARRKPASIRRALSRRRPRKSHPMPASRCRSSWGWRRRDSGGG